MQHFSKIIVPVVILCLAFPLLGFAQAIVSIHPPELKSPPVGATFTVDINIANGKNVFAYQLTLAFDENSLSLVSIENGDYLPAGAFGRTIIEDRVIFATSKAEPASGDGTLAKATFAVIEVKESTIGLVNVLLSDMVPEPLAVTTRAGKITTNKAPVAVIEAPSDIRVGVEITLDGTKSTDDSGIANYAWDFGDGTTDAGGTVKHVYAKTGEFTVTLTVTDDGTPQALTEKTTQIIVVKEALRPVITKHKPGEKVLALKADILKANTVARCYVPVWKGEIVVKAGISLEYQVRFPLMSVHRLGGVFVHTANGNILGNLPASDDQDWMHRQVALNALTGQKIVAITLGMDNTADRNHPAGSFQMMADNIQITDGKSILTAVWVDEDSINGVQNITEPFGDVVGVENCEASVRAEAVAVPTAVHPKGKLIITWGAVKSAK